MIILHRKCDRIVRSSRPVIAESLYHGVIFCLPLFGKKVAELCCTNVCKTDKNGEKHLSNFSKYSIHLKHSKHPFVQKTAVRNPEMTAILQKRRPSEKRAALSQYRFSKGAFRASGLKQPVPQAHFALRAKRRCKCKIGAETSIYHPKSVADFAARRRQMILIIFPTTCASEKFLSARKCGIRPPMAGELCAQRAASPLKKERLAHRPASLF